ncbi:Pycsar system effector family protein [Streptomyces sp. NPDC046976]|uniref:Pycsar system effector family protein n=1 Tax=Streptomyces sp. NPDC046976 TaxID=3155258 RepID=UPI0033C5390B
MTHIDSAAVPDVQLNQARTDVITEIVRTDSKAAALLTAFGIPLAVLVATVPGRHINSAAAVLVGLGAVGLVAAMLTVLLVVRPRLGGNGTGSFLHWADCTAEDVIADLTTDSRVDRLVTLSQIARQKYKALRLAVDVTAAALLFLVLALLVDLA